MIDYAGHAFPARGVGPGDRVIVWVRGCARACPGCIAPELAARGEGTAIDEVASRIRPLLDVADGLTLSGGEPFDQADALADLVSLLRREIPELEVLVYTGYLMDEVRTLGDDAERLLALVDMVIDGPFLESEPDTLQWRGSDNQRVHILSERAARHASEADSPWGDRRPIGIQIHGEDSLRIVGIPRRGDMERHRQALRDSGYLVEPAQ